MSDPQQPSEPRELGADDPWESTVERDLRVGRMVGEYEIRRRIGVGGMGIVYEAVHPQIGRRVAIKVLRPDRVPLGSAARNLLSEAKAISDIRHRHIIDAFGFGELPGIGQYLVMDYLEGHSLAEEIRLRAPMDSRSVIAILDDTLAALSAAHSMGWVHRDLKPANLFLVDESGGTRYVKVLDFGLAKSNATPQGERQTRAGTAVGTPEYMAPEQATGQAVDGRTDLYALGVIAFEMLTGTLPFSGADVVQITYGHVHVAPPKPRSVDGSISLGFEALVLHLLEKDPGKRPPSADAVRSTLKRLQRELTERTTDGLTAAATADQSALTDVSSSSGDAEAPTRVVRSPLLRVAIAVAAVLLFAMIVTTAALVLGRSNLGEPVHDVPRPSVISVAPAPTRPSVPEPAELEVSLEPAPGGQPKAPPALTEPPTGKMVATQLTRPQWRLLECFDRHQAVLPAGAGRVEIQLTIEMTGRVSNARVTTAGLEAGPLAGCVVPRLEAVRFPRHPGPAVTVIVPFAYRQAP